MKICFVDPKGIHFGLNTGIGYIAAYFKKQYNLNEIKVFDFNNNIKNLDLRLKELCSYDLIGFSVKSSTKNSALEIATRIKNKNNILFAGGPHITIDGVNFIKKNEIFDFGIVGEGEIIATQLLNALKTNEDRDNINGLVYRRGKDIIFTGNSYRNTNLDELPFPDYSNFDSDEDGKIYNYPLVTSRGCPCLCTYCCVKGVMGKNWYARSVENIIQELKEVKYKYKSTCFNIQDDNFTLNMDRAKKFCESLIREALDFKWSCPNGIRADKIDRELMGMMRQAGCFGIAIGVESGNEEEFKSIKKGESLEDVIRAVQIARENKIWVFGNFIIGLPNSSLESIRKSIKFAKKLKLESCIFNLLVPFPGTEILEWVKQNGKMLMNWEDGFTQGKNPKIVFETDNFTKEERLKAYCEANIKCNNYFAFIDEHETLLKNISNVLSNIIKYDFFNIPAHILWVFKHFKRITLRIIGNIC